jgi:uncharacterized protein involved in exopolysaccharide biosynthesis
MESTPAESTPSFEWHAVLLSVAKSWRLYRNCIILGVLASVGIKLVKGKRYTSTASIVPQAARSSQLRGIAAQFGIDVGGADGAESPYFYVSLVETNELRTGVVNRRYVVGTDTGDYAHFQDISVPDSAMRTYEAIRELNKHLGASADRRTNIVTISATEKDPVLALQVVQAVLAELTAYNKESRQTRAGAERRFAEGSLATARKELKAAEDSLQDFMVRNREFRSSPSMTFEYERLQRSVEQHSGVVTSLAQNYEQSRLDEVRDTPVFSMVESPRLPARHDPRGLINTIVTGIGGGLVLAVLIQLLREVAVRMRADNAAEYMEWRTTLRDLGRNVWRW